VEPEGIGIETGAPDREDGAEEEVVGFRVEAAERKAGAGGRLGRVVGGDEGAGAVPRMNGLQIRLEGETPEPGPPTNIEGPGPVASRGSRRRSSTRVSGADAESVVPRSRMALSMVPSVSLVRDMMTSRVSRPLRAD